MPVVDENYIYQSLLNYRGESHVELGATDISISLNPIDNHVQDSPDFLLWINISFKVFGQQLDLKVPIPIEAEKGGIGGGALEDLQKMIERKRHLMKLPMLVIAESEFDKKTRNEAFPSEISIHQIPIRSVK